MELFVTLKPMRLIIFELMLLAQKASILASKPIGYEDHRDKGVKQNV